MSQITTHILDTALGVPAAGVPVTLSLCGAGASKHWTSIAEGVTNDDGRIPGFGPKKLSAGTYRMRFDIATYLQTSGQAVFYPFADVVFNVDNSGDHYHIPLLLSPFGYSTYRGS